LLDIYTKYSSQIGLQVEGVELNEGSLASASTASTHDTAASVVLIGMRGSGKSFIGKLAASALDWSFIDADHYFEEKLQIGVREFVHQHGWPAFRATESKILEELLVANPIKHVISLGGGIVETASARDLLTKWTKKGYVVHIAREIDEVVKYLGEETARPAYGEPITDVFRRREPWFVECSNFEFVNYTGDSNGAVDQNVPELKTGSATKDEVTRFFQHITGQKPNLAPNLASEIRSYFLSLTYPDITPALPHIEELTVGVDAIELRVDLLRSPKDLDSFGSYIPPTSYVANQLAALRQATTLPIVYTVRTVSQGGAFPDHAEQEAFDLLNVALRMGVEYIDVEISWPEKRIRDLSSRKGASHVIASWHDWSGKMKWNGAQVKEKYNLASRLGDIIKIIGKAESLADNFALFDFVSRASSTHQAKPIIAINMGGEGQMTRILNTTFSPVSHPLLPTKAAPGQLSFIQIQKALNLLGQLPTRRFFLFGNAISQSPSPTLHNTAFETLGLPYVYDLLQRPEVGEEIKATIVSPSFGGASVTIPFKIDILPLLDKLSPAAEAIGAVNTIIPRTTDASGSQRILYGDNTDWLGIRECVRSRMPSHASVTAALIIGAGGTARAALYALHALGAQHIYIFNRTRSKAQELADAFPDIHVSLVDELGKWPNAGPSPNVIVSTLPPTATTTDSNDTRNAVYLPTTLFDPDHEGVVLDAAYKPAETPLLALASKVAKSWTRAQGVDLLLEQGYKQFELWTGRKCPRGIVEKRVREFYAA
jgi:pentafunctional AROM polypeptide